MPPTARTPLARPQQSQQCCPRKFTRCVVITAVFTAISLLLAWEVKSGGAWARPSTWRDYTSSHHNARLRSLETWRANATAESSRTGFVCARAASSKSLAKDHGCTSRRTKKAS